MRENDVEEILDTIYEKYKLYFLNEGEAPNLVTLSPYMCHTFVDYFNLEEFNTIFGMNIIISSEVYDFNKIGVYRIESPDKWKNII